MKILKGIGLFFVYPASMLLLGFWGGVQATNFFYPGEIYEGREMQKEPGDEEQLSAERVAEETSAWRSSGDALSEEPQEDLEDTAKAVSAQRETLSVDTEYVLLETDILRETEVETSWKLPNQYIGMDREQFLTAMENYSSFPPLSEMERGFVNAEVVSFSRDRVVVRMNYQYVQPGTGFYLAVQDHEVVVYLEDQETVYINTGILLETLPEELQIEIMEMRFVEDEGALYNFLETYSS